jgi:hypothetical protein
VPAKQAGGLAFLQTVSVVVVVALAAPRRWTWGLEFRF